MPPKNSYVRYMRKINQYMFFKQIVLIWFEIQIITKELK